MARHYLDQNEKKQKTTNSHCSNWPCNLCQIIVYSLGYTKRYVGATANSCPFDLKEHL